MSTAASIKMPERAPHPGEGGRRVSAPGRGSGAGVARRRQLFGEAIAFLELRCCEDVSLEEVARELATSSRQLQRAFAENADVGFRAQLARLRMGRAADLLRDHRMPIDQVGQAVAYRGAGAFSKAFRRTYGVSPSDYRRGHTKATRFYPPTPRGGDWTTTGRVVLEINGLDRSSNTGGENDGSSRHDRGLRLAGADGRR